MEAVLHAFDILHCTELLVSVIQTVTDSSLCLLVK